ncbi:response regulator transcription factor [Anabaena sp. UHCC 0253]|uniref:response regulator n=1 Tax=Anabaena sp. UHCC 0253 TaxID=2590019 RepID=UPI001445554C|nr:response regulator transcription factor [Anabaena sp. UHCC 0253]MTJ52804.1 response regulator transcription factor [Anabaena sp. UHCC 0253]
MSKIRIAIIEDHELTRLNICTTLRQKGDIEVVGEANNASRGLILLKTIQPDIAIVDIGLPDQDGIELTRKIKTTTDDNQPKIKVLILTMQDNKESVIAAFNAGADSYCMKDINCDNLLEAVRVTASGNPWIDPMIARIILERVQQNPYPLDSILMDTTAVSSTIEFTENQSAITPYLLTERELEVLKLIVEGCSNAAIAQKLYITIGTVKTHVRNIMNKLCADDRTQAAVMALRSGLVA